MTEPNKTTYVLKFPVQYYWHTFKSNNNFIFWMVMVFCSCSSVVCFFMSNLQFLPPLFLLFMLNVFWRVLHTLQICYSLCICIQKCTYINVKTFRLNFVWGLVKSCLYQESFLPTIYCMHLQVWVVWLHWL